MRTGQRRRLDGGWEIAACAPGTVTGPGEALERLHWLPARSLGSAAAMLRDAGAWSLEAPRRFDAEEWWFRTRLQDSGQTGPVRLVFEGLATVADAWLNGAHLLHGDNMFVAYATPALDLRPGANDLVLRCQALDPLLQARRPRPRWRAPLVEHQQLRWFRTSLLGRLPGWCPPVAPVGPWKPVWIEDCGPVSHDPPQVLATVEDEAGVLTVDCRLRTREPARITGAELVVERSGRRLSAAATLRQQGADHHCQVTLRIPQVALWWPHTHGEPALYEAALILRLDGAGMDSLHIDLGRIGFRTLQVDREGGDFAVTVNGTPVFCRGACWTPPDIATLHCDRPAADRALARLAAAGMNMVRVGGTMVYESDDFLDACDARGILLWQDLMFANMDYPREDPAFEASVALEVSQLLDRLSHRPCLAVLCGNSEAEQQAAMWGAPREHWDHPLFTTRVPALVRQRSPHVPYWPSSAHGGSFPHQGDAGTTSYYGVGAYLLPLADARRAGIRFATECLGIANIPEDPVLEAWRGAGSLQPHSPRWKARVPRDANAGWDFDDVRDHYLAEIFGLDPLALRYADPARYVELGRVVSAEVMGAVFREWRRAGSTCRGALIWFLKDLWPGAGWGILDSRGSPKAAWHQLRRLLQPRCVVLTDERGNGLLAHVVNEAADALEAALEVSLVQANGLRSPGGSLRLQVPPRGTTAVPLAALLDGFTDLSYAYRFGPPPCEAVMVTLQGAALAEPATDFFFPLGHRTMPAVDVGLAAHALRLEDGSELLEISAQRLARFVTVRAAGFEAEDQYFHVAPGTPRRIRLAAAGATGRPAGEVRALNGLQACRIALRD